MNTVKQFVFKSFILTLFLALFQITNAQLFYNNGSQIVVKGDVDVDVNGTVSNNSNGFINNEGTIHVEGDWMNNTPNGALQKDTGLVILDGDTQYIGGNDSTTFHQLVLTGTGRKILSTANNDSIGAVIYDSIALNDRPFELNSRTLVINTQQTSGITRTTGRVISESQEGTPNPNYSKVQWNIGDATGNYTIPFGTDTDAVYIPLEYNITTAGAAGGNLTASTYPTDDWQNTPYGDDSLISNMAIDTFTDKPAEAINRFWRIDLSSYSTKPQADITFTWNDSIDLCKDGPCSQKLNESELVAQRWRTQDSLWELPYLKGSNDAANNQLGLTGISESYSWWTLTNQCATLHADAGSDTTLLCASDSVQLGGMPIASGGAQDYTYSWSPSTGMSNPSAPAPKVSPNDTTTYTLTLSDSAGCSVNSNVTVQVVPPMATSTSGTDPVCNGVNNGTATVNVTSGGTGPYDYVWSNGDNSSTADSLPAGTHYVTVTDDNSCTTIDSVTLTNPPVMTTSTSTVDPDCNGGNSGMATVNVTSGGTSPFSYNWSNGDTTQTADTLVAGDHYVSVTDDDGCIALDTATLTDPPALSTTMNTTDESCAGSGDGSINLQVSGGSSPYSFDWSTGATTEDISGLSAGTYDVEVTDDSGCVIMDTATIQTTTIQASTSPDTSICKGDQANLQASGGNSYSWTPTGSLSDPSVAQPTATPDQDQTYQVVVSTSGCSDTANVSVTVHPLPMITTSGDTVIPQGASTQISASVADSSGNTYSWMPTAGLSDPTAPNPIASPSNTKDYVLTVTDANTCTETDTVTVEVVEGEMFIPTAFSPNDDGQNDQWKAEGVVKEFYIAIYDRWGNKVYESEDISEPWDGTFNGQKLSTGVYVFYMKATLPSGEEIEEQGNISLMR